MDQVLHPNLTISYLYSILQHFSFVILYTAAITNITGHTHTVCYCLLCSVVIHGHSC